MDIFFDANDEKNDLILPKKGTGNVSISVPFLARSSHFFRRLRRKKCPFIRYLFSEMGPKKDRLIKQKKDRKLLF